MNRANRLGIDALARFPADGAESFTYDRAAQSVGIVHFGIGAFHRAHQAWYTDAAMNAGERDWMIAGVSLRSAEVAKQMNPQQGIYTVTERSADGAQSRLIGAVRDVLVAPKENKAVIALLAAPTTHIASLTITEKGYCRGADGALDPALLGERSVYHYLAAGLRRRHDFELPGLTLLSCDNLAQNGSQLARLMREFLDRYDPSLVRWFEAECSCPSTMVDRIVPATTEADREEISETLEGLRDEAAVMTEPFNQWVIEDRFSGSRPRWEAVGAELVADVRPYETAKLRMLNGAHSALAYIGLGRGHGFVHEAIADPDIRPLIERLMHEEAAPTIVAAPGQDLAAYADALLDRFANPALKHRLSQIAMDGSQKLPQRWLETLVENRKMGRECPGILSGIAAWITHLRGMNGPLDDPRAAELTKAATGANPVDALFGAVGPLASDWVPSEADRFAVSAHLESVAV